MNQHREIDTTKLLWDYLFKVRMPYLQTRSLSDIRNTGVVVTGIREIDNDIPNQEMTTMLSISQMAEYFKEGVRIKVVNHGDVKTIYEYISQHIHTWKARLERGVNIGNAPVEDLILLDEFANTIYEHAKYQFTPEIANSLIGQHFANLNRANVNKFFVGRTVPALNGPVEHPSNNSAEDAKKYPERDSIGEFFKNRLVNLRRY